MSFSPIIIDTGVFKQLPSGEALDVGGWTLPTTGGTENYALIADGSGNAIWAQPDHGDFAGLGDDDHPQYVRNNGETSNVDLGSQTLTTTGTVVGSNIPAPTASNQLLQAVAANVAAWSTDVTGLTSLLVDNIAIDGATILSTTGAISFGDEDLTTTGILVGSNLPSPTVTGKLLTSTGAGTATWQAPPEHGDLVGLADNDHPQYVMYTGATDDVDLGAHSLTTTSTIVGSNIPSPTVTDKILISTGAGTATWQARPEHGDLIGLEDDDHPQYQYKTGWDIDYANTGKTDITVTEASRTLSITPTGADFDFWIQGIHYTKTTQQSVVFDDTDGLWFFQFDNTGTATASQTAWNLFESDFAHICIIYWDVANQLALLIGPEYHTYTMDPGTHHYLHFTFGTRWESGLGVAINGDNLDVGAGKIHDEDIEINIADSVAGGMWQQDLSPASLPIFYRTGTTLWKKLAASTTPVYLDTNIPQVNTESGGNWVWTAVPVARYFVYWVIATNDQSEPVILVPGQEEATTLTDARDGNHLSDMLFGNLPIVESKVVARIILRRQGSSPFYSLVEVNDYRDLSDEPSGGGSIVGHHGNLTGLGEDDHPQYVVYTGAIDNIDLGSYTFTTTGTVVGSNIPAPSVAAKVLTSTGIGTATWQDPSPGVTDHGALTGLGDDDHTQYVTYSGASGTVNLGAQALTTTSTVVGSNIPAPTITDKLLISTAANTATWQDPSFGYDIPANTAQYQVYAGTGFGGASWTTDLIGLTSLGVDNITLDGFTISSSTGVISFGTTEVFSLGTVIGSNIPSPGGDDQVLIATAADTASWSAAGNNEVLGSDGSGNVAWEAKSFGYDIPDNTAAYQVYAGTGVGTAAWTTDLIGLTSLTVDNITIDGDTISSSSGELNITDGIKTPLPSMYTQGLGTTYTGLVTEFKTGVTAGTCVIDLPVAFLDTVCDITIDGYDYTTETGGWSVNIGGYTGSVDGEWFNYRASIQGQPPFTSIRLGYNGNTGKACIMLGTTSTAWNYAIVAVTKASMAFLDHDVYQSVWAVNWYSSEANFVSQPGFSDPLSVPKNLNVPSPPSEDLTLVSTGDSTMEWVPWNRKLTSNETVYVTTTGNDTTGDGSVGAPFLTLTRTLEHLHSLDFGLYNVYVDIAAGTYNEPAALDIKLRQGRQVFWQGVASRVVSQDTSSISASDTLLPDSSGLRVYDVTMILPGGITVAVGDYVAIRDVAGGANPEALIGCHYVSGWDGGTNTATIQIVFYTGCTKATGTVTCTIDIIETIIAFDNTSGITMSGPYHGGNWNGLVLEGNYNTVSKTGAARGVAIYNRSEIVLDYKGGASDALGVVGFQVGLEVFNQSTCWASYCYINRTHFAAFTVWSFSYLVIHRGRISGGVLIPCRANHMCLVWAHESNVVGTGGGSSTFLCTNNSMLYMISAFVDLNNTSLSLHAIANSCIDATSVTQSDGVSPTVDGNNDGSYIIGI